MSTTDQDKGAVPAADTGRGRRAIDEETLALVRRRIGIPVRHAQRAHNEVCSSDSFRHFAQGYGDDNPLYCAPPRAEQSVWKGVIAPPMYPISAGVRRKVTWSDEQREAMTGGDPLAGIGQYMCGERWLFLRPVRPGTILEREQSLHAAELKQSEFGGGTGALVSHIVSWRDRADKAYALRFLDFWHADRESSADTGKYRDIQRAVYSEEDTARIDECYATESVRGAEPRLVGDVSVGDVIGPIVKGPLCISDVITYHMAVGWGTYGGGASKVAYTMRQRMPKFYVRTEFGYWDSVQRCHWEDAWAQHLGQPTAYDYGAMRTNWMVHLVTNWMGDGAWLWKLAASVRKFNYLGDAHWMSGIVTAVDARAGTVDIEITGMNQRGEVTCAGGAVVILPSEPRAPAAIPPYQPSDVPVAEAP